MKDILKNPLIHAPDILDELDSELRKQGFAGATNIPRIVYLAATTRMFAEPVSLVVMGPSGSGKTHSIESGLQFIPPDAIESIAGMSEKALPYLSGLSLKNRVLYLGEAAGMADGNGRAFLRQLMTEGKLDYLTVQKTSTGMKGEKLPTVEGPISFMMATTANHIHHEDQSRMLTLNLDENPDRIREALRNKAIGRSKAEVKLDLEPWYELHNYIADKKMNIIIPYAEEIVDYIDVESLKIQRDFPKLLSTIKACALVHFSHREQDGDGNILANEQDYKTAYELLNEPISHGLEKSVRLGVVEVVEAVQHMAKTGMTADGVSQSQLAEHMKKDRSVVGRNIHAAVNQGYLTNENPGQGREAKVKLGSRKLPTGNALPSPEELFKKNENFSVQINSEAKSIKEYSFSELPW
ncbi:hypothetical protein VPK21_005558 [Sinorhizobium kummerowiae]|uniref:Uncharacterized protein n=1 Tax=Sinorhizobium kummerowiae TaxID=158892 RepID=A0ABY8TC57_9HYPH|nr:hypothetical protein [Sinorhizobium kummerowiae]WHS95359.1 hypothetical protein PZL22_003140 [Sinorhizobium kummerowiae]WRW47326.1 hypothetical protein VPK21_005558 [Sinorhizobium kummerowiae]